LGKRPSAPEVKICQANDALVDETLERDAGETVLEVHIADV
jgi:hypothetical protein